MKKMINNDLQTQLSIARKDVDKARAALETAEKHLKELDEQIKEADKQKPFVYFTDNSREEIIYYRKYSDEYIEFKLDDIFDYRYVKTYTSKNYTYPPRKTSVCTIITDARNIFERCSLSSKKYKTVNYIDHIELLEGVDEYDKN